MSRTRYNLLALIVMGVSTPSVSRLSLNGPSPLKYLSSKFRDSSLIAEKGLDENNCVSTKEYLQSYHIRQSQDTYKAAASHASCNSSMNCKISFTSQPVLLSIDWCVHGPVQDICPLLEGHCP